MTFAKEDVRRSAKAGDLTLNYYEAGPDSPTGVGGDLPLVMLHGGGPGASAWSNFGSALPRFAGTFRTLLVDQPGFGGSDKPPVVGNYFRFSASYVVRLLDELGIERVHLLGNSLGGGTATRLAIESGFDAVEIHFGHNYFASSFLSPALNRRKDDYGGSLRNRARVIREIADEVRAATGGRIAVLAKLNMDDGVPGGFWLDEAIQVAQWLEADGSLDAIELTIGSSLLNPMYLFKGDAPLDEFAAVMSPLMRFGVKVAGKYFLHDYPYRDLFMLDAARQIRANVAMPLVLLGGITDKAAMDTAMAEGFEFVAMARALLREPDLIKRIRANHETKSLCIHCNKCMPTIFYDTHCVLATPQAAAR
jgi:pimeloyl-ACP methyl ester carboxylesterase